MFIFECRKKIKLMVNVRLIGIRLFKKTWRTVRIFSVITATRIEAVSWSLSSISCRCSLKTHYHNNADYDSGCWGRGVLKITVKENVK